MRTEPYDNQDGRKCWLSRDEVELFLEKAREAGTREEIALSLGARCGLRASEIVGVKPVNLDSHDVVGARIEVTEEVSKTNLPREVPISPRLRSLIQGYAGDSEPSEPIVDVTTRTVERWVNRAAERCQAETGNEKWRFVGPHDLRRTWGTQLVEQEVEPGLIMQWGGWSDWSTFREHYLGAYSPEMERKQIEKVEWL
jgi:integrase